MATTDFDGVITAAPAWADIPQLSEACLALGGLGGQMNAQALAIVARLQYLASEINGLSGTQFLTGTGAPDASVGVNGNLYLDTASATLYGPKLAGVWPVGISLKGADGTAGVSGGFTNVVYITTTGVFDWTPPAGVTRVLMKSWGGGEGGTGNGGLGFGGSGGGYCEKVTSIDAGTHINGTVGAGGSGGASSGANGSAGGDTQVNWTLAGVAHTMDAGGGSSHNGGAPSGGDINIHGEPARFGSMFGSPTVYPANGSASPRGGMGGQGQSNNPGSVGFIPGGGGGGGGAGNAGGAGAQGAVEIWY